MSEDLLLEIGVEELPASFVADAIGALPGLLQKQLQSLRLTHGEVRAAGTPRRLAVVAESVADRQPDLDERVLGPPAKVAFDAEGKPTRAATSFAEKIGLSADALERVETEKGAYVAGRRREAGAPACELLPAALARVCEAVPFKKAMRWATVEVTFGRPVRWLVALFGDEVVPFRFAEIDAGRASQGHRFLSPGPVDIARPSAYVGALRERHVLVDASERKARMVERLEQAAQQAGGSLVSDAFLVEENASLVEEPWVIAGDFDRGYLDLPERVILDVAKEHQRYFGMRDAAGRLLPGYLAVVGTALRPENIRRGNDRVMRARLSDAKFFFEEDRKQPLVDRRAALDGIVFQKRLGSVGDKVRRIERVVGLLGAKLGLTATTLRAAEQGAALCKCDLVTLMVGELPELQGEMGRAYALAQSMPRDVADVIAEHYQPRGAEDEPAPSEAGALVALADRLDTLAGCFAIGLAPTGAADPLALRRAGIGMLRTLIAKSWDLELSSAIREAHAGFASVRLDLDADATAEKLADFLRQRLRGVLSEPDDVVDACLAASSERPYDVALRARSLAAIDPETRALAGEVFKRANNIAREAPAGSPRPPRELSSDVHPSEQRLFDALGELSQKLGDGERRRDYPSALGAIAGFAPVLGKFFDDVFVMVEDAELRNNRLRLMRQISETCSRLAAFNLLARRPDS
jgi:glycyl-tRNA synthetase beta chain